MNFEEWATDYFGENVDFPEACRDAWNCAIAAEREACAKVCDAHANGWEENPGNNPMAGFIATSNCAFDIRERPKG